MKSTKKTNKLQYSDIRKIVNTTVKWCESNLGTNNRRKNRFKISIRKHRQDNELMGTFCPFENCLTVYYNNNLTVKDLIQTTIHEYTHYLQPIRTHYFRIAKLVPYHLHPMEVEAFSNEKFFYKQCKKFVKSKL